MAAQPRVITPAELSAANLAARSAILNGSRRQEVVLTKTNIDVAASREVRVPMRNVGLIISHRVYVELDVHSTVAAGGATLRKTAYGAYNTLRRVELTDFASNKRISASGRSLGSLLTQRAGRPYGAAESYVGYPAEYGQTNLRLMSAPDIAPGETKTVYAAFNVPVSYSATDLTGAIFANITSATADITLTLPENNKVAVAAADGLGQAAIDSIYYGGTAEITAARVKVVQIHYDQLPQANGQYILPALDLQQVYEIKESRYTDGLVAGGIGKIPLTNNRRFLSIAAFYINGAAQAYDGEDIDKIILEQANTYRWFERDARDFAFESRQRIGVDSPVGLYHFETRESPISTEAVGNVELQFHFASGASFDPNAYLLAAFEALGPAPSGTVTSSL